MKEAEPEAVQQVGAAVRQYGKRKRELAQQERRKARRRKIWLWVVGVGMVATPLLGWRLSLFYQDAMRHSVAMRFIDAVVSRDGRTFCELATPEDHEELNLSPEKIEQALNLLWAGWGSVQVHRILQVPWMPNQAFPEERCWFVYWGDSAGNALPAKPPEDKLFSNVIVRPTARGFRVRVDRFLRTTSIVRWGHAEGLKAFVSIRRAARLYSGDPPVWTPPAVPPSVPEQLRPKPGVWFKISEKGRGK